MRRLSLISRRPLVSVPAAFILVVAHALRVANADRQSMVETVHRVLNCFARIDLQVRPLCRGIHALRTARRRKCSITLPVRGTANPLLTKSRTCTNSRCSETGAARD